MELPLAVPLEKTEPESSVSVLSGAQLTGGTELMSQKKEARLDGCGSGGGGTPYTLGSPSPIPKGWFCRISSKPISGVWPIMELRLCAF